MSAPPLPSPPASAADEDAIHIYASRLKHSMLASASLVVAASGFNGYFVNGTLAGFDLAVIAVGLIIFCIMMVLGFDKQPALSIDQAGIFCRRPAIGLIPWAYVAGLAVGKVSVVRHVLLIAIDDAEAPAEDAKRFARHTSSSFLNPSMAKMQGQFQGKKIIQIPLGMLAVRPKQLQAMLEEKVSIVDAE